MILRRVLYLGVVVAFWMVPASVLQAQVVKVRNVRFEEKGEEILVRYDLDGRPGKKYEISLLLSADYGQSFKIRPEKVKGDVGRGVKPGVGKEIVWYLRKDFPYGLIGDGFVFAVDAELQRASKLPYYLLGGGVVGGVVYFVARSVKASEPSTMVVRVPGEF